MYRQNSEITSKGLGLLAAAVIFLKKNIGNIIYFLMIFEFEKNHNIPNENFFVFYNNVNIVK